MQAEAQRLLGFRPLAGLALDAVELEVELVAHLVDGDRGAADPAIDRNVRAADMGDFRRAAAGPQHVADAPQAEADDQHAEEDAEHDVFGVFAELIHGAGGVVGRDVVGVLIGAHAYHPSLGQATKRPLTAEAAAARHADEDKWGNSMARTRRPLIAGNWKMNGLRADGLALAKAVADGVRAGRLERPRGAGLSAGDAGPGGGRGGEGKRRSGRRPELPCQAKRRPYRRDCRRDAARLRRKPRHRRPFRTARRLRRDRRRRARQGGGGMAGGPAADRLHRRDPGRARGGQDARRARGPAQGQRAGRIDVPPSWSWPTSRYGRSAPARRRRRPRSPQRTRIFARYWAA